MPPILSRGGRLLVGDVELRFERMDEGLDLARADGNGADLAGPSRDLPIALGAQPAAPDHRQYRHLGALRDLAKLFTNQPIDDTFRNNRTQQPALHNNHWTGRFDRTPGRRLLRFHYPAC